MLRSSFLIPDFSDANTILFYPLQVEEWCRHHNEFVIIIVEVALNLTKPSFSKLKFNVSSYLQLKSFPIHIRVISSSEGLSETINHTVQRIMYLQYNCYCL
jgi:hypothetical protein